MRVWLIRSENEAHDAINPISERARAVRKARFTKEQLLKHVSACPQPGRLALKVDRVLNGISDNVIETSHLRIAWLLPSARFRKSSVFFSVYSVSLWFCLY